MKGHVDVVDTDVCGDIAELAFDADEYTRQIGQKNISAEVRQDLDSGNWLFGRGVMDMKCGLAMYMAYMAHMCKRREELNVNLLFLAVPDEEGDSAGMRGSLPMLTSFIRSNDLELLAAFSGEPAFWSSDRAGGHGKRVLFTGTTGKIMPLFFCIGREAHAGYCFEGVSSAAIAASVVCRMEGNTNMMDGIDQEILPPPVCLKMKDLREVYSVTLPERSVVYFNVLTVTKSPGQVLAACMEVANDALNEVLARQKRSAQEWALRSGRNASDLPEWAPIVYSINDVRCAWEQSLGVSQAEAEKIAKERLDDYIASLPFDMDEREKGISIASFMISQVNIKGPAIVLGFLPPYYPHRLNTRSTLKERKLRNIMELLCDEAKKTVGDMKLVECFSGIMDLSYMGFQGKREELLTLADNMPGWGRIFSLPMDDLLSLDVPIASIGPAGKDAHKDTERLELDYSVNIAPAMLAKAINLLS